MLPVASSLKIQPCWTPELEFVSPPATMNPPSGVCWTEFALSGPVPPYVFCHTTFPRESSLSTQACGFPGTPDELVLPATMNPPSAVCCTNLALSTAPVAWYVLAHLGMGFAAMTVTVWTEISMRTINPTLESNPNLLILRPPTPYYSTVLIWRT